MKFSFPGLSDQEVSESRKINGANVVTTQKSEGFYAKLLANLKDPIIVILLVALAVTVFLAALSLSKATRSLSGQESKTTTLAPRMSLRELMESGPRQRNWWLMMLKKR